MKHSFIARLKARRENAHFLFLTLGHPLNNLAQEYLRLYHTLFLRHRCQTNEQNRERDTEAPPFIHLYSPSSDDDCLQGPLYCKPAGQAFVRTEIPE
jgi:hypothetical protein